MSGREGVRHPRKTKEFWKKRYGRAASEEESFLPEGTDPVQRAMAIGYSERELKNVPESALTAGLGCGNPMALADLKGGETVLDLGSGAGLDVFVASPRVGPKGKVIGVDMTPEMVEKARAVAAKARFRNVEFKLGEIENLPLADGSVDVIVSNCVISQCPDKTAAFTEAFRVLRPTGRLLISDLVTAGRIPRFAGPHAEVWADWLAGAPRKREYLDAMKRAGFRHVTIVSERRYAGPEIPDVLKGKIISLHLRAYKQRQST